MRLSTILDDQPAQFDNFDFTTYVQALKESIINKNTRTPIVFGVYGRWGTGKTTLMHMLEQTLKSDGIVTVWFNAWQYSKENELWAAFLQVVLGKVQAELKPLQKSVFRFRLLTRRINWQDVPSYIIQYLIRILIVVIPVIVLDPVTQQIQPEARSLVQTGGSVVTAILAIWIVFKPLFELIQKNISPDFSALQQASNYKQHIAFLDEFREHFSDIVASLPQRGDKKLVIFIDDLDRCSAEQTLQVLNAVKLFLDVQGCVFILGLDIEIVQRAIEVKFKDDPTAQREYLNKIVQLPFHMPPISQNGMVNFIEQMGLELPDKRCQDVFLAGLLTNPRELKRNINVFSLLWNIAAKRSDIASLVKPVRLAKIVVIQQLYPDLHRLLQRKPYLLLELEKSFQRKIHGETDGIKSGQPTSNKDVTQLQPKEANENKRRNKSEKPKSNGFQIERDDQEIITPLEISPFLADDTLLRVFFPKSVFGEESVQDDISFANMSLEELAAYFTLSSHTEIPKSIEEENFSNDHPDKEKKPHSFATRTATKDLYRALLDPRILIGQPQWWRLKDIVKTLSTQKSKFPNKADLFLLMLNFQFIPGNHLRFKNTHLAVELRSVESQDETVVVDMFPRELTESTSANMVIGLDSNFKFTTQPSETRGDFSIEYRKLGVSLRAEGLLTSEPSWRFTAYKGDLAGVDKVYLIIKRPRGAKGVYVTIKAVAETVRDFSVIPLRDVISGVFGPKASDKFVTEYQEWQLMFDETKSAEST